MSMRLRICLVLALAFAACSDITNVSPSDTSPYDIASYLWPASASTFTLSTGGASDVTWQITDSAGTRALTSGATRIVLTPGADPTLAGVRPGSFIDLDAGSYLSAADSVRIFANIPRCATLVEASGILYIGADSGVFVRLPSTNVCRFAGLAGAVTAIAQEAAKGLVYVGMADGGLWSGRDGSWSRFSTSGLPAGPIAALAFGADESLYSATKGSHGVYKYTVGSGWLAVSYMQSASVAVLHAVATNTPRVQKAIVIATESGTVGVLNLDGTSPDPKQIAGSVRGFAVGADGALLAATDVGVLSGDLHSNTWVPLTTPIATSIVALHSWFPVSGSPVLYTASVAGVASSTLVGAGRSSLASAPPGDIIALGHFAGALYALTTSGYFEYEASQWHEVPGLAYRSAMKEEGSLTLMHSPLLLGGSWPAGTLVTESDHKSYLLTARLLAHYDSLRVGTATFADVLMIRYANEKPGLLPESVAVPYWVLYFSRGVGLVMAEKVRADSVTARQVLVSSR